MNNGDNTKEFFTITWWNSSLSPRGKKRSEISSDQKNYVASMVRFMICDVKVDLITLGEISEEDISFLKPLIAKDGYELKSGVEPAGKGKFDTCFIYNPLKIDWLYKKAIVSVSGNRYCRIAQQVDIAVAGSKQPFHIFVSHWPSRLRPANREKYGVLLRHEIDGLFEKYEEDPYIILLGDYNDEPFDISISDNIGATRDKSFVLRRHHLLYNPFWQQLTTHRNAPKDGRSFCGSYFHKDGIFTQWRTFDQIIFSHALISGKEWLLHEDSTEILGISTHLELVRNNKEIFDHMPVLGVLEKVV